MIKNIANNKEESITKMLIEKKNNSDPMDNLIDKILGRTELIKNVTKILSLFETTIKDVSLKKGIYIYGQSSIGKTYVIKKLLIELGYEVILYNASDTRNKILFKSINNNNLSANNVIDAMYGRIKKIAIIMDEIDGMHTSDRGSMDSLIKLIRPKKTKKQKQEDTIIVPIICIGNNKNDKKIRELIKACHSFEFPEPTSHQIFQLMNLYIPNFIMSDRLLDTNTLVVPTYNQICTSNNKNIINIVLQYIQSDLRNFYFVCDLWKTNPSLFKPNIFETIFHTKNSNDDAKTITSKLFNNMYPFNEHQQFMNDTDRTTVALLWHENIPLILKKEPTDLFIPFYLTVLENICYADYISRITFQSQIWQFNEMCSLIKTFDNNRLYHNRKNIENISEKLVTNNNKIITSGDIEFTKVLTKYSTEYNNQEFINRLCQTINLDKIDMFCFFSELKQKFKPNLDTTNIQLLNTIATKKEKNIKIKEKDWTLDIHLYLNGNVDLLDIKRIYRYLDKNIKKEGNLNEEDDDDYNSDDYDSL